MNEHKGGPTKPGGGQQPLGLRKPPSGPRPGGPRHGPGRGGPGAPPPQGLPKPRPITYYRDGQLVPELMDKEAERMARQLDRVSKTQVRRFYGDVLTLRQRLETEADWEAAFESLRADFKMLKAKAVYANGRSERAFPREFLQFFIDHVEAVKTAADFQAFCKHFQAVVAFHKFFGREE
jgi:CRISPR-associated protein Csm2